ncbi:secreted RxLR effector protein 161-like [Lactuca sativa]|uniref:secreted RxLR effector protein 161-like n=1 Tax=Lactuca sativa TaxID=4236 RepID=UPI001C68F42F|nr:secreted RxLR effector protein 161-like [Lactuca sativa]
MDEDGIVIRNKARLVAQDMMKKYGFFDCKPTKTLMSSSTSIGADPNGDDVNAILFQGMMGSLLYLIASRPDIMFPTIFCARYQANPKECHNLTMKMNFRYLKHTTNLGSWYPRDSEFKLVGYTDFDHGRCRIDRKSTSGGAQMLGNRLISWSKKKHTSVACSTAKPEYVAAGRCCAWILWIQNQLLDYGLNFSKTPIFRDNTSTIQVIQNPVQHSKTKHIEIRHHFIRDIV